MDVILTEEQAQTLWAALGKAPMDREVYAARNALARALSRSVSAESKIAAMFRSRR